MSDPVYYLAGPMGGIEDWNFPAFNAVTARLRAQGLTVINPAENDGGNPDAGDWAYYMRQDVVHVANADALIMMPGWKDSRGASLEAHLAKAFGLPLFRVGEDGKLAPLVEIVGLSGYARTGKDTASELLAVDGWQRTAFADKLKEALYALDPIVVRGEFRVSDLVRNYGWEKSKDTVPEVRALLQRLGTEVGRELFGPDVWVDLALRALEDGGRYFITDCRFPNEADAIKAAGGKVIRIERPGFGPTNDHYSEIALDHYASFDATVVNDGTLEVFAERLRQAVTA